MIRPAICHILMFPVICATKCCSVHPEQFAPCIFEKPTLIRFINYPKRCRINRHIAVLVREFKPCNHIDSFHQKAPPRLPQQKGRYLSIKSHSCPFWKLKLSSTEYLEYVSQDGNSRCLKKGKKVWTEKTAYSSRQKLHKALTCHPNSHDTALFFTKRVKGVVGWGGGRIDEFTNNTPTLKYKRVL